MMNRPDRRNALDDIMIKELTEAFAAAQRSLDVRVVIFSGAGSSFCAGMDLEYLQRYSQLGNEENLEDARNFLRLLYSIYTLKKPVVAMVQGPGLGGGCGLAAACDFVFAGKQHAKFGAPEVRLGFLPAIILFFLVRRMGEGAAKEFVLCGDILDAARAERKGLVSEIIADAVLATTVNEFARKLARTTSPSSVTLTKDLFNRFHEMNVKDALDYAATLNALTRTTPDFKKGISSFVNKEKLEW